MKKIKFRGRMIASEIHNEYIAEDEMLIGGYVEIDGKPHIVHKMTMGWVISEVKPESVAQLIGVDKNGAEVYEGDKVIRETFIDDEGNEHEVLEAFPMAATFEDFSAIENGEIVKVKVGNEDD